MKAFIKVTLFVALLFLFIYPGAVAQMGMPDWLKGKLLITTLGSDKLDWDNSFEWGKYVRIWDFDRGTQFALEIPIDAHLTRDLGGEGKPIIISHAALGYSEDYGWESEGRWKTFSIASFNDPGSFSYGLCENGIYVRDDRHYFSRYGKEMTFDAPAQILDVKSPEYCVYYLEYAVSDESELQIRFVCETDAGKVVYERYPLNYPWGKWVYAIFPNGRVAYKDASSNGITVNAGDGLIHIPDTDGASLIAWKNDHELLLFAGKDRDYLMRYNVDDATSEFVLDSAGEPIYIEDAYLYDMAVHPELDCVAFCYVHSPNGQNRKTKLDFVLLGEGEQYSYDLYPLEKLCIEERTITNETHPLKMMRAYAMSDDGLYFLESADGIHLELAWQ